jgi:subfamily B ATP-binding cassette protein MsbA
MEEGFQIHSQASACYRISRSPGILCGRIRDMPSAQAPSQTSSELYRRLLRYVIPYKWIFVVAIVGMFVVALGETAFVALLKPIMDDGFVNRDQFLIKWLPLALVVVMFVRGLGQFVDTYTMAWIGRRIVYDLRAQLFDRHLHLPESYFDTHPTANLVSQLVFDCEQVSRASTQAIRVLVRDSINIVLLLIWMSYLSWKTTLALLLIVPIAWVIIRFSSKKLRDASSELQRTVGRITQVASEALTGHELVKAFNGFDQQKGLFDLSNNRNRQQFMKRIMVVAVSVPLIIFVAGVALAMIVWYALQLTGESQVTAGTFISYIAATVMLMQPIRRLSRLNEVIQTGIAASDSIFSTLDLEPEQDSGSRHLDEPVSGSLAFEQVSFYYTGGEQPALDNISFEVPARSKVALVGASGSGKSTVVKLLMGLYRTTTGSIKIDGQKIDELSLASLREAIAFVPQKSVLFNDSLQENVRYGSASLDATRFAEVIDAALLAQVVEHHPDGVDQNIGENGDRLSGGQQQRIAIARALYKDAPILILDEATSALDSEAENKIQTAIDALLQNRTALIIAHRLSTIRNADLILVFDQGRIVEQGSHASLLKNKSVYANLVKAQEYRQDPDANSGA